MRIPVSSAGEQSSREGAVDVLVPTRNRPTELATTLAGLAAQGHPFDVLVSDQSDGQASFDTPPATALLRVLAGHGRRIRTTRHLPRRGLAEHRAAMLAASSAPFPLFCDDDVWLEPGVVGRLHEAIVELGAGWWARLSGPVLPARPPTGRARTVRAVVGPSGARADRAPGCRRGNAGPA